MAAPMKLVVKWSGQEYEFTEVSGTDTVKDLKEAIHEKTGVLPQRQKILGLKFKGKPPGDDVQLCALNIKPNTKIMMMGTREETIIAANAKPTDIGEVVDDFDIEDEEVATENREEYLQKVEHRVRKYEIKVVNQSRPGKKLLVLDVDYTFFAATNMKWIEVKMRELGVAENPNYKIAFMVDSRACITVHTQKYGIIETKPLGVIWGKYEQYNPKNTIMFDDLRRNFLMNPQNGLKIRPFREAHKNRYHDKELMKLAKYLRDIAPLDDFSHLNHRHWERYKPPST
ncbi:ubiquitin-like domain-containing CTD phosphatase 1 isoform X2 [Lytechinus pictus]|uniref:ubiquitin-like domain-containing CTD phosphatase 1 isoform X2 n=1 Tax=Lytechinus pictus TaxID=7653 RepID=UPI0030B9FCFA